MTIIICFILNVLNITHGQLRTNHTTVILGSEITFTFTITFTH